MNLDILNYLLGNFWIDSNEGSNQDATVIECRFFSSALSCFSIRELYLSASSFEPTDLRNYQSQSSNIVRQLTFLQLRSVRAEQNVTGDCYSPQCYESFAQQDDGLTTLEFYSWKNISIITTPYSLGQWSKKDVIVTIQQLSCSVSI